MVYLLQAPGVKNSILIEIKTTFVPNLQQYLFV